MPLVSVPPLLLLQEDDRAPDAWESFATKFPVHSGGLSVEEVKKVACREDFDDGFATYWHLGQLTLSISADDPFHSLHQIPALNNPTSEGDLDD
jgi:hypothetical protein